MEWQECGYSFKIFQYIAEKAKAKAKVHLDDEEQTQLKFGYVNTEKNEVNKFIFFIEELLEIVRV